MNTSLLYDSLEQDSQQIRLLRLSRSLQRDPVECLLKTFDLRNAPSFAALSYTWGSDTVRCKIIINNVHVLIRTNVHDLLLALRSTQDHDVWVWIDQLSINQDNVHEKNQQVSMMGDIYRRASATIIWLSLDPDQGIAFDMIRSSLEAELRATSGRMLDDAEDWHLVRSICRNFKPVQIDAFHHFATLPYWQRLWIAQEIAFSEKKTTVLLYGKRRLDWQTFRYFQMRGYLSHLLLYHHHLEKLLHLIDSSALDTPTVAENHDIRAWAAMTNFCLDSVCQEPRDKVYGIQGLFSTQVRVEVDYERTLPDLYMEVIHKWHQHLNMTSTNENVTFMKGATNLAIAMGLLSRNATDAWMDISEDYDLQAYGLDRQDSLALWGNAQARWGLLEKSLSKHIFSPQELEQQ